MASEASCSHHLPITMQSKGENNFEKYDVFLSHRGPDTKTGFVGFLYKDLENHGLKPYLDRECIHPGEECWESIEDAIKNTPIVVVVFSERYAESEWCLKELHVMLEAHSCKTILPIFYNVTPWDLRNPERGQFKDGFEKLKKKFNLNLIEQWKADLEVVSKLMGWESSDKPTSFQVELVAKVVKRILELANKPLPLDVGEHVVGVQEVANELIQCQVFEKEVFALGLWGMGGIGKSTLAKELYNQLKMCKRFEASCYIEDVTDKIMQGLGVVEIQKRLLKNLCSSAIDNDNKSELKPILEDKLSKKKIVVVLDDVPNVERLNYMMTREMLKNGSVCIVTSRDRRVFEASNIFEGTKQEVYVHEVKMLNMEDSKRVLSSFAFGRDCEMRLKYEEWVTKISKQCCGVPLVLKVCGALLKGEVNLDVWKGVERKLICNGMVNDNTILNCLRISYDFLIEEEKKMFLDIACALLGESEDMGICIWRSQELEPSLGVRNLKKKALISVDEEGRFTMHDHLRDMGREIEQVEAGDTRRLWMPKSLSLLKDKKQLPHSLQTLVITCSYPHIDLALSDMKELRILVCDDTVNLISIPQNLRCLHDPNLHDPKDYFWYENPLGHNFPKVPEKNKLAFLNRSGIKLTYDFQKSFENLTKLETLKLDFKEDKGILDIFWGRRKCVSNFDKLFMLRDIFLCNFNGETISGFSSKHTNLRHLDLRSCYSLRSCLGVGDLLALEELSFYNCPKLKELPNLLNLGRLQSVHIDGCGFKDVSCLGNLISLQSLSICKCHSLETLPDMHKFTRLEELEVKDCPKIVGWAGVSISKSSDTLWVDQPTTGTRMALHTLRLSGVRCRELPDFSLFPALKVLTIFDCQRLERLINTMPMTALEWLAIHYCPELQEVPDLSQCRLLRHCSIRWCRKTSLTTDEITKLEAMCPGLKVDFGPSTSGLQRLCFNYSSAK